MDHGNLWDGESQKLNTLEHYAVDDETQLRLTFSKASASQERSDENSAPAAAGDSGIELLNIHYNNDLEFECSFPHTSASTDMPLRTNFISNMSHFLENGTMRLFTSATKRRPVSKRKTSHTRSPSVASGSLGSASATGATSGSCGPDRIFHLVSVVCLLFFRNRARVHTGAPHTAPLPLAPECRRSRRESGPTRAYGTMRSSSRSS